MTRTDPREIAALVSKAAAGMPCLVNAGAGEGVLVEVSRGRLARRESWSEGWVSLLLQCAPGMVGLASATLGPLPFNPEEFIARAKASARLLTTDPARNLPEHLEEVPLVDMGTHDAGWTDPTGEKALAAALTLESAALDHPRVHSARKPTFEASEEELVCSLSGRVVASWRVSDFGLQVEVAAGRGRASEAGWASVESHRFSELDPLATGGEALLRAVELLGARSPPSGAFPAIIDRRCAAEALELLSESLLADTHRKKTSLLKGALGKKVLSGRLTIVDDGALKGGPATSPVDAEGTPTGRTVCVRGGRLKALLYDRAEAARQGVRSTGNAQGTGVCPPKPSPSNLYIQNGDRAMADLPGSMGRGLVVREILGFHTADPISGDFSVGCSGFWVEGGAVAYPVSGAMISGNLLDLFARVEETCDDFRFAGSFGSPSLLVGKLDIAAD